MHGPDHFESRSVAAGARIEAFSVPLNYSTVVIECTYELRHYDHLGEWRHVPLLAVRAGLGGP